MRRWHDGAVPAGERSSPRERFVTLYGRRPVLEALSDPTLVVEQVFVDREAGAELRRQVTEAARARSVPVRVVSRSVVTRVSRNGRQHQGVAADVAAPRMRSIAGWLASVGERAPAACVVLDGVTTPANVGMIVRAAAGSGLDGIVVPTVGVADIGPLVIKASAGTALRAPLVRVRTALEAVTLLGEAGFDLVALEPGRGDVLWRAALGSRIALIVGGEAGGISEEVRQLAPSAVHIPMAAGVESLNVASAASVACFELARRRFEGGHRAPEPSAGPCSPGPGAGRLPP